MKKRSFILCMGVFGTLFLIASFAVAQRTDNTSQVLHESLGEVIDSKENTQYNIFGDITGFTAARIYKVGVNRFQLHLLRNAEGRAQILILDLPFEKFSQLSSSIVDRIHAALKDNIRFDHALYPIEESKWAESSVNKKVALRDGSQLLVTLKRAQHDTLIVQTAGGLQIPVPDINIAEVIGLRGEIREGKFFRIDPNGSRLFFAPTGRGLNPGSGYFADYYVFFPTLAFGVTSFFSVGGGISLIPGAESQLLYFAPKLTLQASPKMGFAAGFLYLAMPDEDDDANLGYAVTTIGSNRSGVTLGAGFPLTSVSDKNPILLVGGEAQVSNGAKLITENWIFTGDDATLVFSGGIRFFGDKLAVDLAFISTAKAFGGGGFPFLPWVDFSVFFGK